MAAPGAEASEDERRKYAKWLELCRRHFLPFVTHVFTGDYIVQRETQLVAAKLERFLHDIEAGKQARLMIIMPPRVGKSEMVSRMFPAWLLGQHPDWNVGVISYGDDLAWEMSGDCRAIVQDEAYAEIFGRVFKDPNDPTEDIVELDTNAKSVKHWKIRGHRGGYRAAGINGALTGKGFNCLILDDPTKGRKEADSKDYRDEVWMQFKGTFYPRRERGGGAGIIVMGTAWHIDDIIGRIRTENQENEDSPLSDHWEIIHIPAQALPGRVDPIGRQPGEWLSGERLTVESWEFEKANSSPREWAAQYLGNPLPDEGQIFYPYEEFLFEDPPETEPGKPYRGPRFGFIDSSHAKNRDSDFSALGVFQVEPDVEIEGVTYRVLGILDMFRARWQYPELKKHSKTAYQHYGLWGVVIEDYSAGRALGQEFKRDSGMRVFMYRPDRDKYARAHAATGALRTGTKPWRVRLPKGDRFPSGLPIRTFCDELQNFQPGGEEHDDQVDVFTTAVIMICVRDAAGRQVITTRDFAFV